MKQLILLFCLCVSASLFAQAPSVQDEAIGFISFNEQKVLGLAQAFSEEQYDWRPAEGVRSVGESLLHLAAANYFFMLSSGYAIPEGINPMEMETAIKGKENVIAAVKDSYAYLKDKIGSIEDDQLGDEVKFPFEGEFTKMSAILLGVDHCSEHLGQLIAYARMNGITPPWSGGGE